VQIECVLEVLIKRTFDLKVVGQTDQLTIRDRAQVVYLFQQAELFSEVSISPTAGIIVVDLDLLDQK
jgi:hypothetical protein